MAPIVPREVREWKPSKAEVTEYLRKVGRNPNLLGAQVLIGIHQEKWFINRIYELEGR